MNELNDELLYDGLDEAKGCETFAEIQNHNIEGVRSEYVFKWENRPDSFSGPTYRSDCRIHRVARREENFRPPATPLIYSYGGMMADLPIAKHGFGFGTEFGVSVGFRPVPDGVPDDPGLGDVLSKA